MFTQSVECAKCGELISKNWVGYVISSDVIDDDRGMGDETAHEVEAEIECPRCGAKLLVKGTIYEYPTGAYNHHELSSEEIGE